MENMKKYVAEFIGTLVLVLFACGTAAVVGCNGADPNAAYLMTALAFGLVIVAMAYSIGNISGCHINPAVSIAMLVSGKMSVKDFVGYVVAQFLGAIAGAAILMGILGGTELGLGQNGLFEGSIVRSLIVEIILTFVAGTYHWHPLYRHLRKPCQKLRTGAVHGRGRFGKRMGIYCGATGWRRIGCPGMEVPFLQKGSLIF